MKVAPAAGLNRPLCHCNLLETATDIIRPYFSFSAEDKSEIAKPCNNTSREINQTSCHLNPITLDMWKC